MPQGRTSLVTGGPGAGKTVFALQTLVNAAQRWDEPGIFVGFEEDSRQLMANAASFGWDLPALTGATGQPPRLFFLDARLALDVLQGGRFDLGGLLASLKAKANEMGARRIVFDSVDALLTLLNDQVAERQEVYRLHDWLAVSSLTGIVTLKVDGEPVLSQRFGFMQFMADCVVLLSHRMADRVSLREAARPEVSGLAICRKTSAPWS